MEAWRPWTDLAGSWRFGCLAMAGLPHSVLVYTGNDQVWQPTLRVLASQPIPVVDVGSGKVITTSRGMQPIADPRVGHQQARRGWCLSHQSTTNQVCQSLSVSVPIGSVLQLNALYLSTEILDKC